MAANHRTASVQVLERLFGEGVVAGYSDAELLERFTTKRDADAFAAIVARYGPMVMAVCRGHLGCRGADSDDAFQATFLVLMNRGRVSRSARRSPAGSTGWPAAWLARFDWPTPVGEGASWPSHSRTNQLPKITLSGPRSSG